MARDKKLKECADRLQKIIRKYDVGASVILHKPGHGEHFNIIDPSYSSMKFEKLEDGQEAITVRITPEDFKGDLIKQKYQLAGTANMLLFFVDQISKNFLMYQQVYSAIKAQIDIENEPIIDLPDEDPSSSLKKV
jgi:hypothetical protein